MLRSRSKSDGINSCSVGTFGKPYVFTKPSAEPNTMNQISAPSIKNEYYFTLWYMIPCKKCLLHASNHTIFVISSEIKIDKQQETTTDKLLGSLAHICSRSKIWLINTNFKILQYLIDFGHFKLFNLNDETLDSEMHSLLKVKMSAHRPIFFIFF